MADQVAKVIQRLEQSIVLANEKEVKVFEAISGLQGEVKGLREVVADLQESTPKEVDLSPILDMIDLLDLHIEEIHAPDATEPAIAPEPEPITEPAGVDVGPVDAATLILDDDIPE